MLCVDTQASIIDTMRYAAGLGACTSGRITLCGSTQPQCSRQESAGSARRSCSGSITSLVNSSFSLLSLAPVLQAASAALKALEAKAAAERQLSEQRLQTERAKSAKLAAAADAGSAVLRSRVAVLRAALEAVSAYCFPHPCCNIVSDTARGQGQVLKFSSCPGRSMSSSDSGSSSGGSSAGGMSLNLAAVRGLAGGAAVEQNGAMGTRHAQLQCSAGERWVYLHQSNSLWSRTRQLLQQREAPDGLGSLSSSGE